MAQFGYPAAEVAHEGAKVGCGDVGELGEVERFGDAGDREVRVVDRQRAGIEEIGGGDLHLLSRAGLLGEPVEAEGERHRDTDPGPGGGEREPRLKVCQRHAGQLAEPHEGGPALLEIERHAGVDGDVEVGRPQPKDAVLCVDVGDRRLARVACAAEGAEVVELDHERLLGREPGGDVDSQRDGSFDTGGERHVDVAQPQALIGERWRHGPGILLRFGRPLTKIESIRRQHGGARQRNAEPEMLGPGHHLAGVRDGRARGC